MKAKQIIQMLNLKPLPQEGGFYQEIYRARGTIPDKMLGKKFSGPRNFSTAIYYLITPESFSTWHRIPQDEIFHFYLGDGVDLALIEESGNLTNIKLGNHLDRGEKPVAVVPGNTWQALQLQKGGAWALMGTTVAPGFDFKDFQAGNIEQLSQKFPRHRPRIRQFSPR